MDYMHLGVRSRKTGINARQGLEKDEYSMERIDDFFSEDSTSHISGDRRKSRRSSMLSLLSSGGPSGSFVSDSDHQQSTSPSRRSSRVYRFSLPENDTIQEEEPVDNNNNVPIDYDLPPPPTPSLSDKMEQPLDGPSIRLTPEKSTNGDVPDLIQDDEDTRDYTSFNTSENALLEDEMDDDYEAISEEDRDYVEGESSLEQTLSADDSDSSSSSGSGSDAGDTTMAKSEEEEEEDLATVPSRRTYGYDNVPPEIYDSDEEYIQKQAPELDQDPHATDDQSLRRSNRVKIAPLEWWRNEKVVYKRKTSKPVLEIDKIVTYDKNDEEDDEEELSIGRRKGRNKKKTATTTRTRPYNYIPTGKPRGRPRKHKAFGMSGGLVENPNTDLLEEINQGKIPQGEWLQHGILEANVNVTMDRQGDEIIAFAPNLSQSEQIKETEDEHFSLEVMFDAHKDHFASGMLKIPRYGKKKLSDSYNVFITFFVVQGVLEVTLAGNTFLTTEGSSFQVPAFNEYALENRGNNEVKMFFTQVTISIDELQNGHSTHQSSDEEDMQSQSLDAGVNDSGSSSQDEDTLTTTRKSNEIASAKRSSLSSMSISDI
ncbi:ZYRO0B01144p [Zygosaccharomyces rouxii]|uniref:CENP-C homolog n=1 Tax=Zygosaccharomyces rouxii (strain ATCC 2623 / CBS 732 / NBRC 1130 / NCYC 568 / NRRL Y-229) TaxID=559307 RepID=C5DQK8_ZYGRC|nr:uncharacterized protein ZYRO0B01144g [Zygosaccharomyces rouxii]KAH9200379.1 Mif2/CENP-C like-domain-containing protein [Zygosaccharomyces rouxii]CAR26069.1 ZYRO0B01144p [Zygosaccharomyces rouxii]